MAARSCLLRIWGAIAPFCLFVELLFWATPCVLSTVGAPGAGPYERLAAEDLVKYIEMMTGAKLRVAETPDAIEAALSSSWPVMIVGEQALLAKPDLRASLAS